MKFFIMGATGFIGKYLCRYLLEKHYKVVALARSNKKAELLPFGCKVVLGDPLRQGDWQKEVLDCDVIVNLVGRNIFTRWTPKVKEEIYLSRINSTKQAVKCLSSIKKRDALLINANAIGYYGLRQTGSVDENSPSGDDFLAKVCVDWQNVALMKKDATKRVIIARIAPVLGKEGGMLAKIVPLFKIGLGGKIGSGRQSFSWIHIHDLARAVEFVVKTKHIQGPVNFCSPLSVTNYEFTNILSGLLNKPAVFPVPSFVLKILLKELGDILVSSSKVFPKVLLEEKFSFMFSNIEEALKDILWGNTRK